MRWPLELSRARGASTVEFALALLLFLPALFYSVWIGESYHVGLKAQEAEVAAMWDATAYRVHDYRNGTSAASRLDGIAAATQFEMTTALADLDSTVDGPATRRYVGGVGRLEQVACRALRRDELRANGLSGMLAYRSLDRAVDAEAGRYLEREGTVTCLATTSYEVDALPKWFSNFGKNALLEGVALRFSWLGVGGSGRGLSASEGGQPREGAFLLLDDWALEEAHQRGDAVTSSDASSRNPAFYRVAEAVSRMEGPTVTRQQVQEVTSFLLARPFDPAQAPAFKLALHDGLYDRRFFVTADEGVQRPFIFPIRGDAEAGLPSLDSIAAQRRPGNYLGHDDASFLGP